MGNVIQFVVPLLAVVVTVGVLAVGTQLPALVALAGLPLIASGVWLHRRSFATAGVLFLFVGILYAGIQGHDPGLLLVATAGMVLAWDGAIHAISLREQLDETAQVRRGLLAHTGATLLAASLCAALVYVAFLVGLSLSPFTLLLFLVGAVFVLIGLGPPPNR